MKRFLPARNDAQRQHQKLAFGKFQEVIEIKMAFALLDLVGIIPALAAGQQLA